MLYYFMLFFLFFFFLFFFFNDTATTEIYTLSLHDALPIPPFPAIVPATCMPWPCPSPTALSRRFAPPTQFVPASTSRSGCVRSAPVSSTAMATPLAALVPPPMRRTPVASEDERDVRAGGARR